MANPHSHFFLIAIYLLLIVFNSIGVYLYRQAYYKMHKTKMIRSVYYLIVAFLIENIYFAITAIVDISHNDANVLMHPILWAIPKLILLGAIIFFIQASVTPSKFEDERDRDCAERNKRKVRNRN